MELILNALKSSLRFLENPILLLTLVAVGIVFYKKNLNIEREQEYIVGEKVNSALELTFSQLTVGIIGGIVASMLLFILGVTFDDNSAIETLFILSFILMFYKPRMICFSYSGAILGLGALIISHLSKGIIDYKIISINTVSLILFVAIMHLIEGIMVILDGYRGAVPTFKVNKGRIIGGFKLSRNWLVPTVLIMFSANKPLQDEIVVSNLATKLGMLDVKTLGTMIFFAMSLYAMVGFKAKTFTLSKENKAKESGGIIIFYAIILMVLAQLSRVNIYFEGSSLLLMPIIHEAMLSYQRYRENNREYTYISDDGISVLDFLPNSPLRSIGIESGDKITSVNGFKVREERDIIRIKNEYYSIITVELLKKNGSVELHEVNLRDNEKLHLILVPNSLDKLNKSEENKFEEVLKRLKKEIESKNSIDLINMDIREKEIENKGDKN
ncbi:hypothetical protein [Clostridium massiliamazoniense]|uniref:hypothetical protein n=1 Tax=Clostridium massiliamazoniense TaxID=1347366 RepID=UPI0006D8118F|nr:hypothetical protein [Clostridium massiliamazoniense]